MTTWLIRLLRIVIAALFIGAVLAQVITPFLARDLTTGFPEVHYLIAPYSIAAIVAIVCIEIVLVAVWKLLSMVRRGQVFTPRAFRWVDLIIGSAGAVALLAVAVGTHMLILNIGNAVVTLTMAACVALPVGFCLLMLVMRGLLASAVADRNELAEVI